ncbi:MAG: HDOD domain-containing protein [Kofleriaceae bacterium]
MPSLVELESSLATRLGANKIKIPPYPAVASKIEQLSKSPRCSLNDLANVVHSDPALAANVLAAASNATTVNRATSSIPSLFDALSRIGLQQLIEMALASGLGKGVMGAGPLAELRRDNWRRALLTAYIARMLASNRRVSGEQAYLAGLLHDFGAVIAVQTLEDLAKGSPLPQLEFSEWRAFVRTVEGKFGKAVATSWKLPTPIADIMAQTPATTPLAELIDLVERIVDRLDDCPTAGISALCNLPDLSDIERCSIGSVVQEVVASMAAYTKLTAAPTPTAVAPAPRAPQTFPVSFDVTQDNHGSSRARGISTEILIVESKEHMAPNWLVELTLQCTPQPFSLLANVKSCEPANGGYAISVQPFALANENLENWVRLVMDARDAA